MKLLPWTLAAAALVVGASVAVVAGGHYDVAANTPHWQPVHRLLEATMHQSVRRRARAVEPPPSGGRAQLERGAACYRAHCAACHGGPGEAPAPFARSLQPLPGPLVDAAARWRTEEIYWITRHGIKMSGMPAWEHRLSEPDLWAVVAFVEQLGQLGTADYRRWMARLPVADCTAAAEAAAAVAPADASRGRRLMSQYACNGCHRIPGVTGSAVDVGARDAQDMAAYLATLR